LVRKVWYFGVGRRMKSELVKVKKVVHGTGWEKKSVLSAATAAAATSTAAAAVVKVKAKAGRK
jgi:hypothetical protein